MLKRLLFLSLAALLIPATFQVEARGYFHSLFHRLPERITLQLYVEGDASAVRLMVEELRKKASDYGLALSFANQPTDFYEARIIVTLGRGSASDPMALSALPVSFVFSSAIVMAREGKILFTSSQSSVTAKGAIALAAREISKHLYEQYEVIKNADRSHPTDNVQGRNDRPGEPLNADVAADIPKVAGVYCKISDAWAQLWETPANIKVGGMGTALLTWGFSKVHINQTFDGPQAKLQIAEQTPIFYIVGIAVSDTEAAIVRLRKKGKRREVSVASLTAFSSEAGYRQEDIIAVTVSRISANVVKITPQAKLQPGEYLLCLESFADESKGYDFGVKTDKK